MIRERFMVSGVPINPMDENERVTGYLRQMPVDGDLEQTELKAIIEWYEMDDIGKVYAYSCRVDPETVQPMRLPPKWEDIYKRDPFNPGKRDFIGNHPYCPNCGEFLGDSTGFDFCPRRSCGQALDWEK